jgi:hypothetical protein
VEGKRFGARWSLARTPPNDHVRPRPPIVNWVYQTFRAHSHPRAAAPARSLTPQLRIACSTTARPAIPISHRFPPSRGVYMFVIEPTCARVDLCECSRMFADAGLSGCQSGFGVKKRGAVPRVHLRGSGDRDIEQVVRFDRHSGSRVHLHFVRALRWGARLPQELRVQCLRSGCLVLLVRQASGMYSPRPFVHHKSSRCSQQISARGVVV